jgi:hypothetical protein
MSSVLRYDGANVLELGIPSLDKARTWLVRRGTGAANVVAAKLCDCGRAWAGTGGVPGSGDGEDGARTEFRLPGPLEPVELEVEVEAFLAKGLLRTDMAR